MKQAGWKIRRATIDDVEAIKTIRLTSLDQDPTAFGHTHAEEAALTNVEWLERVAKWTNGQTQIMYLAWEAGVPCAIAAAYIDSRQPSLAHVFSMWVDPRYRRTGLATAMLESLVAWAKRQSLSDLHLVVTSSNTAAIECYRRQGFSVTGDVEAHPLFSELTCSNMTRSVTLD
jgi:ribosomal protein S18 acetylase RimI-like enzyme